MLTDDNRKDLLALQRLLAVLRDLNDKYRVSQAGLIAVRTMLRDAILEHALEDEKLFGD